MFKDICKLILSKVHFPVQFQITENMARNILNNYSPKPKGCCYAINSIDLHYDLQIIIHAYNAEKYLKSCLESVFTQRSRYETLITVVNDESTDFTRSILDKMFLKYGGKQKRME